MRRLTWVVMIGLATLILASPANAADDTSWMEDNATMHEWYMARETFFKVLDSSVYTDKEINCAIDTATDRVMAIIEKDGHIKRGQIIAILDWEGAGVLARHACIDDWLKRREEK